MSSKCEVHSGLLLLVVSGLVLTGCKKETFPNVNVMPLVNGAVLDFRGFVTDSKGDLVSDIAPFARTFAGSDTLRGRPISAYVSQSQRTQFYADEDGNVWERATQDLGARVVVYGYVYRDPIQHSYWHPLLQMDHGKGTNWEVRVDTTFEVVSVQGGSERIRYILEGKARFQGWAEVLVPESKKPYRALEAYWPVVNTYIIKESTGDSLFVSRGWARQYFEPQLGAIKYITDFTKKERGGKPATLRGTWELTGKNIPS